MMDLAGTFRSIFEKFEENSISYALIGGFALHFWGYSRATNDLDFIVFAKQKERVQKAMEDLGFKRWAETENVGQYESGNARVDFIYAFRPHGLKMVERAALKDFLGLKVKVARAEDIIGLKVQSLANNPARWLKEMADIETLLAENRGNLDLEAIEDYFALFQLDKEWKEMRKRYETPR